MNLTGQKPYMKATAEQKKLDREFLAWLRTQRCLFCEMGLCEGDVVAAHVTIGGRASKGMKPLFSAVPLCHRHHMKQHEKGYQWFGDKSWWLEQSDSYYRRFLQLVR